VKGSKEKLEGSCLLQIGADILICLNHEVKKKKKKKKKKKVRRKYTNLL
jgi:ribonuclease PH